MKEKNGSKWREVEVEEHIHRMVFVVAGKFILYVSPYSAMQCDGSSAFRSGGTFAAQKTVELNASWFRRAMQYVF